MWKGSVPFQVLRCLPRAAYFVSVGSWSLVLPQVTLVCLEAPLTLLGLNHVEKDTCPLRFGTFLSNKSLGPLGCAPD